MSTLLQQLMHSANKVNQSAACRSCTNIIGSWWKCDTGRDVTRLDGAQGKRHVWRPRIRNWSFRSKCTVLKKVLVVLLGLRDPRSDSSSGELCPLWAPSLRPWILAVVCHEGVGVFSVFQLILLLWPLTFPCFSCSRPHVSAGSLGLGLPESYHLSWNEASVKVKSG